MIQRILYAAGPGDVIHAHQHWVNRENDPTEVAFTYSGQVEEFCREHDLTAYFVSSHGRRALIQDENITIEHRPRPMQGARGIRYHLADLLYVIGLAWTAVRFRADLALIHSATSRTFLLFIFRLVGIRVIPILHNPPYPAGHPPTRRIRRFLLWIDGLFWKWGALATLCVSPECARQIIHITGGTNGPLYQFRSQFSRNRSYPIPPPPFENEPFRIVYFGRIDTDKGVFDVLEMAHQIEARIPGRVCWDICGVGPDLERLRGRHVELGLTSVVTIHGWVPPAKQSSFYAQSHAAIVPTRSSFNEGMAKSVVEAAVAGRPVITNLVVSAVEVFKPACVLAKVDDVQSYVDAILNLLDDPQSYDALHAACPALVGPFFDRTRGIAASLQRAIAATLANPVATPERKRHSREELSEVPVVVGPGIAIRPSLSPQAVGSISSPAAGW